jgi:hypothetical protein
VGVERFADRRGGDEASGPIMAVTFVCEACEDQAHFSPGAGRAVVDWLAQHVGPAHALRVVRAHR